MFSKFVPVGDPKRPVLVDPHGVCGIEPVNEDQCTVHLVSGPVTVFGSAASVQAALEADEAVPAPAPAPATTAAPAAPTGPQGS